MRRLILPAIILSAVVLFSMTACNPWQYMTVNSPQLTRNDFNQFVFENDTLRLIYDMAGDGGQVTLRIRNKTSQPLTINWEKSAFIRNQQSVSLPQKTMAETNGINSVKFRQLHYDEAGSPIRFKAYLTFTIGHDNKEFSLTNNFYVSDVYQADGGPESFSLYHGHGDQIYIRQKTYNEGLAESPPTASSGIR